MKPTDAPREDGGGGDDYEPKTCPACGRELLWEDCPDCDGTGTYHDCGEDCCPCAEPDLDDQVDCPNCNGEGRYLVHDCAKLMKKMEEAL